MQHMRDRMIVGAVLLALVLFLAASSGLQAQEADLSSSVALPGGIPLGKTFTVTVGYANAGPDTANSAFPNAEFVPPMGLDVFLDNFFNGDQSMYNDLQSSATDTLGNLPLLFWDDYYCETVSFQVQGIAQPGPTPIARLDPGESGSFSFETAIPMDSPRTGAVEITSPPSLAKIWTLTDTSNFYLENSYAGPFGLYGATSCEQVVGTSGEDVCAYIDENCWGTKVSHLAEPIEAEFVLVDDGSVTPTFGCAPIVNDVSGKIAVLERGTCEFGDKGFNAEQAGALAVFMVNDGQCVSFPSSPDCVINLGPGTLGSLVTIPVIQVSQGDGVGILDALRDNETVTGVFGSASVFATHGWAYHSINSAETDPDSTNDVSVAKTAVSPFADGFESGDTSAWSAVVP